MDADKLQKMRVDHFLEWMKKLEGAGHKIDAKKELRQFASVVEAALGEEAKVPEGMVLVPKGEFMQEMKRLETLEAEIKQATQAATTLSVAYEEAKSALAGAKSLAGQYEEEFKLCNQQVQGTGVDGLRLHKVLELMMLERRALLLAANISRAMVNRNVGLTEVVLDVRELGDGIERIVALGGRK